MLFLLMTLLGEARAGLADGPKSGETPCDWMKRARKKMKKDKVAVLATQHHELFSRKDIKCLKKSNFRDEVVRAAKGPTIEEKIAVEQEKLDALRHPMDLFVYIQNPSDMALKEIGPLAIVGSLWDSVTGSERVPVGVYDGARDRAQEAFDEEGIEVTVSHAQHTLQSEQVGTYLGEKGIGRATLPAGDYRLLRITIADPVAVAENEKGELAVVAANAIGMDVVAAVRKKVVGRVLRKLKRRGGNALVLDSAPSSSPT